MIRLLTSLMRPFKTRRDGRIRQRRQLGFECLEDRTVPSTLSSITSNFNGTAIQAGDAVWFNAAFKASGLGAGPVSIHVTDQVIKFNSGDTDYTVNVPDSVLNFSAANTVATTSFTAGQWVTNLPMSWSGNAFLGGATFFAASGLPGGVKPVTWSGNFSTDTPGVSMKWQWGAAVYTSFSGDYNSLNVKPLDSNSATVYHNSDHAGTPEAFKGFVTGGARGGGGSNWTGSYSGTAAVVPTVNDVVQLASISGHVYLGTVGFANVTITLSSFDSNGNIVTTRTAMTDGNGFYQFTNVAPGSYQLLETVPLGYSPSSSLAGTVNGVTDGEDGTTSIDQIALAAGDIGINYDFFLRVKPPGEV